nr:T9SS type A sorting domain-containing protein [uncultured Dyadobacter sp.]
MVNVDSCRNLLTAKFSSLILAAILTLNALTFANAQSCPDPGGGTRWYFFDGSGNEAFFPEIVPAGKTGSGRATSGKLTLEETMNAVYPLRSVTINPELSDGTTGKVVLRFDFLDMAPSAVIKIYQGTSASGTPAETITSVNAPGYVLQTRTYTGSVTVTFESPVPAASGDFKIYIPYTTGDETTTSAFGFQVAYWKKFITANSYTAMDSYPEEAAPIATAYFDENKNLVSSEISFCIDYGKPAPSMANSNYIGEVIFFPSVRPDLDKSGSANAVDQLKAARLVYILNNISTPVTNYQNFMDVQSAVNSTTGPDYTVHYSGLHGDAIDAIPSLPSPAEPTFSVTGPAAPTAAGTAQNFTVNLADDGGHPRIFKLEVPAGVTVNSVTGAAYDAGNGTITFAASPGSATVSVTNTVAGSATLRVVYNQPGFWNVNNLIIYEPCTGLDDFQGFIGLNKGDILYPFREASATWSTPLTPFACADAYFYVDNKVLYKVDIATGTRSGGTPVQGDPNAIGYNVLDNFIWGYDRSTNQVTKLGANGSELFTIPNMPAPASATSRTVGTVDLNGYLYLYEANAAEYITIDINPARTATYLKIVDPTNSFVAKTGAPWGTTTIARNIFDWAYNPTTGLIHALINGAGSDAYYVSLLNPVTGVSTLSATAVSGASIDSHPTAVFDSQFFDTNGNLIVFSSNWYSIDPATNTATQLSTKPYPLTSSDGASCALANAPTPFVCSDAYYQVETDKLYSVDAHGTRSLVATLSGNLNAIGYSNVDNLLWGYDNASNQVFKLGANGIIQRFSVSNMPATIQPDGRQVGTVSTNGYMYLYEKNGLEYITIDIDPSRSETYLKIVDPTAGFVAKTATPWGTALSGGGYGISDWSFNNADNLIYALTDGSSTAPYQILQVNPLTGSTTLLPGQVNGEGLQTSAQDFGSSIVDTNGNLLVFGNVTGHLYRINVTTKVAKQVSAIAAPSSNNDGALCLLASNPPLPVTLVSFEARPEGKTVNLTWSTTRETNSDRFEVERSLDAKQWITIGVQQSAGESKDLLDYRLTDDTPLPAINYYRLKMVDNDGTYAFSSIRSIEFGPRAFDVSIYPNPATDILYVKDRAGTDLLKNARELSIINVQGAQVYKLASPASFAGTISLKGLKPGIYIFKITLSGGTVSVHRIVVGK